MGTTPTYALPYPEPSDLVQNVDDAIEALALAVDDAIDAGAAAADPRRMLSGRWYRPNFAGVATSWAGSVVGSGAYVPVVCYSTGTINALGVIVTTAAATAVFRLGIYADSGGVPGNRLVDAGTVSAATTGNKTIAVAQAVTKGQLIWVYIANQTAAAQANTINGIHNADFMIGGDTMDKAGAGIYEQTQAGALPAASGLTSASAAGTRGWMPYLKLA